MENVVLMLPFCAPLSHVEKPLVVRISVMAVFDLIPLVDLCSALYFIIKMQN